MPETRKAPPVLHNVLPIRYRTWLEFYDSIPLSMRQADRFRCFQGLTKKQFMRVFGYSQPASIIGKAEYITDREWLLARIGEELLASRLDLLELKAFSKGLQAASKAGLSDAIYENSEAFWRLWEVAKRPKVRVYSSIEAL